MEWFKMKIKNTKKRLLSSIAIAVVAFVLIFGFSACHQNKEQAKVKTAVPFSQVKVDDGLMRDYTKLVICNVIPTAITNVEKAVGGIPNIKNCALWHEGKTAELPEHQGAKYVDSDVHKVLESMCMALDTDAAGDTEIQAAQAKIAAKLNEWIE